MDATSIATEIRRVRVDAGLTQGELARRAGTTQSALSRMESGRVLPSIASLANIAEATGKTITLVIGPADDRATRTRHTGPPPAASPTTATPESGAGRGRPLPSARVRRG